MTFETMVLRSLFGACIVICGLFLAAMVTARPIPLTANGPANAAPTATAAAGNHAATARSAS